MLLAHADIDINVQEKVCITVPFQKTSCLSCMRFFLRNSFCYALYQDGCSALMFACQCKDTETVELLLAFLGVNVNLQDKVSSSVRPVTLNG